MIGPTGRGMWLAGAAMSGAFGIAEAIPRPDTVWPTALFTYAIGLLTVINLAGLIHARVSRPQEKAQAKAVEAARTEAKLRIDIAVRESERRFQQLASDLSGGIGRLAGDFSAGIGRIEARMNEDRQVMADHEERIRKNTEDHVQSREDRRHLSQAIEKFEATIERWRQEDRDRDDRILGAMVQLRGGTRD